ncbi:MAG TPA: DUF3180 domain-containing protein [Candidatus Nanopelagicales bacterium]|jgi:hypothetical protein|nr:DUF3180 domain-containing protein [Candidatus Nanopelagicales bacterium]
MRPTRVRLLLAVAVVAAVLGWLAARFFDSGLGRYFPVPWTAPATLGLLALALVLWTRSVRSRLAHRPGTRPLPPIVAARTAALALAASRVGAFFLGWYAGVLVQLVPSWQVEAVRAYSLAAGAAVLAALAVVVAALWLERSCRLPDPPPDTRGERSSAPAPQ